MSLTDRVQLLREVYIDDSRSQLNSIMGQKKVPVVEIISLDPSRATTKRTTGDNANGPIINSGNLEGDILHEKALPKLSQREKIRTPETLSPRVKARRPTSARNATPPGKYPSRGPRTESKMIFRSMVIPSDKPLKSIFSPSKVQKNVNHEFIDEPDELDLGFKDLPVVTSAKKLHKSSKSKSVSDEKIKNKNTRQKLLQSKDDTACKVCEKYDSGRKNPMLLCDGCESGYHIKCLDLSKVPETEKWFCPNCLPNVINTQITRVVSPESIENFDQILRHQQQQILDKLTGKKRVKLKGFGNEIHKVQQIVEQTVLAGEGNSMLIIGSRGTGKTTLVESVITEISRNHRKSFHVVRLNGFIHTDDKLALKEIWRQLGKEMNVVDDSIGKPGNYADILLTLLALLSHRSDTLGGSESNQTAVSVIFILDEFDLFTFHHRQTLLYNLFDIAQSRKAPIVVLGLTTKVDITESLEKRVKSRFSHRFIYLSLPKSLPEFWEICKEYLVENEDDEVTKTNEVISPGYQQFSLFWREMIDDLYNKDASFMYHLQSIFYRTKSVPAFINSCILPIVNLSASNPVLNGTLFTSSYLPLSEPDSKLHILQGLSELELALLIAAARLDIILNIDTCNFSMAYNEYSSLTSQHKIQNSSSGLEALGVSTKIWGQDISFEAWEKLISYELLIPAGLGGGHARNFEVAEQMWRVDVDLEEILESVHGLSKIMTKWCKGI